MNRLDILEAIKANIQDKLTSANGYKHTPVEVRRGNYNWMDFSVKPVVCFTIYEDDVEEEDTFGIESIRKLGLAFYIYADDNTREQKLIHELTDDLQNFLHSDDFLYSNNLLIGKISIKEGSTTDPMNASMLEAVIRYQTE
jgi:hypothetical protein